jgi:transposase
VLSGGVRIWLAFEPVDMRLSFDGLAGKIAHALGRNPYSGECFVFRSKSRDQTTFNIPIECRRSAIPLASALR